MFISTTAYGMTQAYPSSSSIPNRIGISVLNEPFVPEFEAGKAVFSDSFNTVQQAVFAVY